ncbi:MAG: methionyl-tRNA formyltransferase [Candidatus Wildermuthbacteria bacterium]|nr:methionyl-tRNA formyltransferase [Candidatus Wildermuthbacteria bacterium]
MENRLTRIAFLGREYGLIVKKKLEEAGYQLVDPNSDGLDLIVVGFYGNILPKEVLAKPKHGALNVHPSLLPKYRGPTPVLFTILNGDSETGVTIIKMDEEVDHGPILAQQKFFIGEKKFTKPELRQILWELGGDLLVETIPKWIGGEIQPQEQDHSKATYTKKLTREDGRIDWNRPAEYIERQVRALTPWPGAFTIWKGKRIKILNAHIEGGKLVIDELQMEGKKPTTLREFLLGHKDFIDSIP